ncbi:hypothetical protein BJK06_11110 [Curtobacterium sp. BH-2-1-1]|uniref:DUF58 domain-containing protein n=1 Tax=Curtobacterium sp. BH-2-1-1 TaxID=1905847 RepID=UPI00089DFB68|nr:DUF58 domain-containing protein [Curtobacterium sp. BH-2-1-1]AOX66231.1 hypothetical protein BJK06_11110 [Curtobacterium sp. BH-2-1-1]
MSPAPTTDAALRRLELTVRRRIDGVVQGDHPGLALGSGSDPEELVRYQPGHDVRRIDWNASARAGEPYVWLTRAEHALETWVLVDRSPSMAFGTTELEKADVAAWAAAAIGLVTQGGGDRVGIGLLGTETVRWIPPGPGRLAARRVLRAPSGDRDGVPVADLAGALTRLSTQAPRRGLRVVVSDLLDPDGDVTGPFGWEQPLRKLAARNDVVVIEVVDPRELELPDVGDVVFVDPESGVQRDVSTSDRRLRKAYAEGAATHRAATAAAVRASGADHLVLRTDDDLVRVLTRFVHRRHRAPSRSTGRNQ